MPKYRYKYSRKSIRKRKRAEMAPRPQEQRVGTKRTRTRAGQLGLAARLRKGVTSTGGASKVPKPARLRTARQVLRGVPKLPKVKLP